MNEKNGFAVVRRPSSAVEKAAPGAKRILSGMIVDALALARKNDLSKPIFTVLVSRGNVGEMCEFVIKQKLEQQYNLRFFGFGDEGGFYCDAEGRCKAELLTLASDKSFDLIIAYGPTGGEEIKLLAHLNNQYGKPIIATSGFAGYGYKMIEQLKSMGIAYLNAPFTFEEFWRALQGCRKISTKISSGRTK